MLKINSDNGTVKIIRRGSTPKVMAEMSMALHAFYNQLDEKDRNIFVKSFNDCKDMIFAVDDTYEEQEEEQEQEQEQDIDKFINSLDALKDILKELSE